MVQKLLYVISAWMENLWACPAVLLGVQCARHFLAAALHAAGLRGSHALPYPVRVAELPRETR